MLRVQRSATTTVVVTVTELTTISPVEYLWEFIEEQTDEKLYAIISNISTSTSRYDEFTIIDGTTVTFPIDGYYTYNIYEQAVSGSLDPTGKTIVEHGRMHVYQADVAANEYTDDNDTNSVYE